MLLELLGTAREPLPECHPPDAAWSRPGSAFLKASHGEPLRMCRCATHHAVISAGDPGSPPRLLAAVGRPLVNDRCLQKFADAKYVQMIPNVCSASVERAELGRICVPRQHRNAEKWLPALLARGLRISILKLCVLRSTLLKYFQTIQSKRHLNTSRDLT